MEVIAVILVVVGLVGFDLAAMRWGADTRESGRDREDNAWLTR
jgi:hypothetical protein